MGALVWKYELYALALILALAGTLVQFFIPKLRARARAHMARTALFLVFLFANYSWAAGLILGYSFAAQFRPILDQALQESSLRLLVISIVYLGSTIGGATIAWLAAVILLAPISLLIDIAENTRPADRSL